jgi:hypothetical protein
MNKLFTWDELSNEITERSPEDLFRCNAEGGWYTKDFIGLENSLEHGMPVIEIRMDGYNHLALETWCETEEQAHEMFMQIPEYAEYQE